MRKLSILLIIFALSVLFICGCTEPEAPCAHADSNTDGVCDTCGEKIGECTHTDENADNSCDKCGAALTPVGELALVTDGKPNFQFVITSACRPAINTIYEYIDVINARLKTDAAIVNDIAGNDQALEIIFGTPKNRAEQYRIDEHYLGHKGYTIKAIDGKILVLAGSTDMYAKALEVLVDDVFEIGSKTGQVKNLSVSGNALYEKLTTGYPVEKLTIAGADASEFVIAFDPSDTYTVEIADTVQTLLYRYIGVWANKVDLDSLTDGKKAIIFRTFENNTANESIPDYRMYVDGGCLVFESKFPDRFKKVVENYFADDIIDSGRSKVVISESTERTKIMKDIYYSEFQAVGDGVTDDFMAIKRCHDYANLWGHTVHADEGKTYYFGVGSGKNTITIKTDTYWHGAKFIFDDRYVKPNSDEYETPIFTIAPDGKKTEYTGSDVPFTELYEGDTKVNWQPGVRTLVVIYNSDVRHFIRFGDNENNGSSQNELLIILPDGTIDPSTPVQWDYEKITQVTAYPCDDKPITVSGSYPGADPSERAFVETKFNGAPSEYTYYQRNILTNRSNVLITSVEHVITGDDTSATGAPYRGFTSVSHCENVVIDNFIFYKHKGFSTIGSANTSVGMGSYELRAEYSNNVTWKNCTQSNFFNKNGSVSYNGMMGTNYCKNLTFDNMFVCSFDAHCGTYNATIKNSTCEHLNFIGEGTIRLENVTMYTDGSSAAMIFRKDYGATWEGNVIVDGLTLKTSRPSPKLSLIKAEWVNHYFGYEAHLPETIEINNVKILQFSYGVDSEGNRWETINEGKENFVSLHIYADLETYTYCDISNPDENMSRLPNDYEVCNCKQLYAEAIAAGVENISPMDFNDTDGDNRCNNKRIDKLGTDSNATYKVSSVWCWGFNGTADKTVNTNPVQGTKKITVTNCGSLNIELPQTYQFAETELWIDGERKQDD